MRTPRPSLLLVAPLALAAACAAPHRALVVPSADVESALVADACVGVTKKLGREGAQRLLAGHVVRPGRAYVLVVREWTEGDAFPARRLTASIDADLQQAVDLPNDAVRVRADRASADGSEVRALEIAGGHVFIGTSSPLGREVDVEVRFADPSEPPIRFTRPLPERNIDQLRAIDGRADRNAGPEGFLRP